MVYHKWSWKVLDIIREEGAGDFSQMDRLIAQSSEAQTGCPITYSYSREQGGKLLEDAGFVVTDLRVGHIFSYSIPEYKAYRYVKAFPFNTMSETTFREMEAQLGWHLMLVGEPLMNQTDQR